MHLRYLWPPMLFPSGHSWGGGLKAIIGSTQTDAVTPILVLCYTYTKGVHVYYKLYLRMLRLYGPPYIYIKTRFIWKIQTVIHVYITHEQQALFFYYQIWLFDQGTPREIIIQI